MRPLPMVTLLLKKLRLNRQETRQLEKPPQANQQRMKPCLRQLLLQQKLPQRANPSSPGLRPGVTVRGTTPTEIATAPRAEPGAEVV